MASSSPISTPPSSNDLPRLPLEIWMHIFEDLESLENLQSLISASPTAFYYFQGGKRYILRPLVDHINSRIDSDIISMLLSSSKIRKLLRNTAGLTLLQIRTELSMFVKPLFRPNRFQYWDQNLSAVTELTKSFRRICSALYFSRGMRDSLWLKDCTPSARLSSHPEVSISELKKFFVAFMKQTIRIDLSKYHNGIFLNPRSSVLGSVVWQAANPNLQDVAPKLWQPSSYHAGGLAINGRGLSYVAGEIATLLHQPSEDPKGGYTHMKPLITQLPSFASEELRLK
ncbi:hypothetical protein FNYG_14005 [Fusarium nygamai]|uniref:F-box domain-containing protein n=1 Tax=Gibberella nygamai TaxID=42673 RepID=A0A2K0UU75_GIBNY|nr:hypothetical protein FNYG_14005 [Fusarium nygamai]